MYSLCNNNLSNIIIKEQEISHIITIFPINKAIGPDCISPKMLKSTKSTIMIVKPLTLLFNRSLSEFLEICSCNSLFKKDDPSLVSNYRLVSLISCASKVMERITCISKHVYNYFYRNGLFYRYQAGFLPGHSSLPIVRNLS